MEKFPDQPSTNLKLSSNNMDNHQLNTKRHHGIQLTLNDQQMPDDNHLHVKNIIDQTPTPIRYLRHCEEVTLLQDINLNPFDFEFRKASQYKTQISLNDNNGGSDSLETPRILPLVDSDGTITSTSKEESTAHGTSSFLSTNKTDIISVIDVEEDQKQQEFERKKLTLKVTSVSCESSQSPSVISTPTPVITAGPSVSQALGLNLPSTPSILSGTPSPTISLVSGTDSLQSLSPSIHLSSVLSQIPPFASAGFPYAQSGPSSIAQASVVQPQPQNVPSSPATVLQLVLRLPNGESIPVEIPATPVATTSSMTSGGGIVSIAPAPAPMPTTTPAVGSPSTGSSLAKMKLKQALTSSATAARPGPTKHSRANTADRIAQMTRNRNTSGGSMINEMTEEIHMISGHSAVAASPKESAKRPRRNSSPDMDPSEKRKKFLERNREAAVRCRQKKKQVVKSLFARSEDLERANQRLQNQVAVLKSMLLQHKDCPVTRAMQAGDINVLGDYSKYLPKAPETNGFVADILKSTLSEPTHRKIPSVAPKIAPKQPVLPSVVNQVSNAGGTILLVNAQEPTVELKYRTENEAPRTRAMSLPILPNSAQPNSHDFMGGPS